MKKRAWFLVLPLLAVLSRPAGGSDAYEGIPVTQATYEECLEDCARRTGANLSAWLEECRAARDAGTHGPAGGLESDKADKKCREDAKVRSGSDSCKKGCKKPGEALWSASKAREENQKALDRAKKNAERAAATVEQAQKILATMQALLKQESNPAARKTRLEGHQKKLEALKTRIPAALAQQAATRPVGDAQVAEDIRTQVAAAEAAALQVDNMAQAGLEACQTARVEGTASGAAEEKGRISP